MPPSVAERLPQELIDCIIDHAHDDLVALKTFSLVCKAWQPSTALHLFRAFRPVYRLRANGWDRMDFATCYHRISSSSRVSPSVRCLELEPWKNELPVICSTVTELHSIMQLMPRLQALHFRGCIPILPEPSTMTSCWRHIQEIRISDFIDITRILNFLPAFQSISKLDIIKHELSDAVPPQSDISQASLNPRSEHRLVRVDALDIVWKGLDHVFAALMQALPTVVDFTTLAHLTLHNSPPILLSNLPRQCPNLKSLTYMVHSRPPTIPAAELPVSVVVADFLPILSPLVFTSVESNWRKVLRDLELLLTEPLAIPAGVVLRVVQELDWVQATSRQSEAQLRTLERSLLALDFSLLKAILSRRQRTAHKKFTMTLQFENWIPSQLGPLGTQLPACLQILQEVLEHSIGGEWCQLIALSVTLDPAARLDR